LNPGVNLSKKIYTALRRMGFAAVFDTNFGADLTIMEEAAEFVQRFAHGKGRSAPHHHLLPVLGGLHGKIPRDMIDHFSSAKSPHEMVGAMAKTYYAQKNGLAPENVEVVSIMPCTPKNTRFNAVKEMRSSGFQDVDTVLTTRELSRMIRQAGIDFANLPDSDCDQMLGDYSGAGTIFGATGGVMEAALRTAAHMVTGENLPKPDFESVRGLKGVKETTVTVAGKEIRIAVAHGLGQRGTRDRENPRGQKGRRAPALPVRRGHGLPGRVHRRRGPALRRDRRTARETGRRALRRGQKSSTPMLPRQPAHPKTLQRFPGRAPGRKITPSAAHHLHAPAALSEVTP
jgi:iron only hydrogenase large subunit-like protein